MLENELEKAMEELETATGDGEEEVVKQSEAMDQSEAMEPAESVEPRDDKAKTCDTRQTPIIFSTFTFIHVR